MSTGLQIFNAAGKLIYDTSVLGWMLIDDTSIVNSNQTATRTYPQLAGLNLEAKVVEVPIYNALNLPSGRGFYYILQHNISVDYTLGYPRVTLGLGLRYSILIETVNIPMQVYVFVR